MAKKKKLNLEREDIKNFRKLLANYGYGVASFTVDENKNPKYIRLDGATYDVHNEEHITELAHHFVKLDEAVKKVEESYSKIKDLPEHIDTDIYNYHPRWIFARMQYNMIPKFQGEIECPLEMSDHVKTFSEWNKFYWLSIGEKLPVCDIPQDHMMTAAEYDEREKEINFLTTKEYFEKHFNEFLKTYKGDTTELEKYAKKVIECENYSEEFDKLKELIKETLTELDYSCDRRATEKINREFYHRDLNAFLESVYCCILYAKWGVKMEFSEDNFPLVVSHGKKYDFRNANSKIMFLNNLSKPSKTYNKQKNKKKRK